MKIQSILRLDARLSEQLRIAEKPGVLRNLAVFFAHSGDSWFWGAALILVWWLSNSFWRRWSIVMLVAISILAALVMGLKFIIRRRRPEGEWGSIYRNTDPHSFPSGHAARAFLIAVVASALAPFWLAILLWIWAPLVSIARVAMGVHYVSDVVAGAALGIAVALIGLQFYEPLYMWFLNLSHFPLW